MKAREYYSLIPILHLKLALFSVRIFRNGIPIHNTNSTSL